MIYVKKKGRKQSIIPKKGRCEPAGHNMGIIGCFEAFSSTYRWLTLMVQIIAFNRCIYVLQLRCTALGKWMTRPVNLSRQALLSFVQILDNCDVFKNTQFSFSYSNEGKDVILKTGVSNKFVLRIYKSNVLLYVSLSFYSFMHSNTGFDICFKSLKTV